MLDPVVVHNLALVSVIDNAVLLDLTDVLVEVNVVNLELALYLERRFVFLLDLLGQFLTAFLDHGSSLDVLLLDVVTHLNLFSFVFDALEQQQGSSDLHAYHGVWHDFNWALGQNQGAKLGVAILEPKLVVGIDDGAVVSADTDVTHLKVAVLSSTHEVSFHRDRSVPKEQLLLRVQDVHHPGMLAFERETLQDQVVCFNLGEVNQRVLPLFVHEHIWQT